MTFFLLPAYFLSDLGAVIDMKHATIMYVNLGIKHTMKRLHTGHVSVSIVELAVVFECLRLFCWREESSLVDRDRT